MKNQIKLTKEEQEVLNKKLLKAAKRGSVIEIQALLDKGADIEAVDKYGVRPIHNTALNGRVDATKLLLKKGAFLHVQVTKTGYTPLHLAAAWGEAEIMELLIGAYAPLIKMKSVDGMTPLHLAAMKDHVNAVDLLLKNGADIQARDNEAFTPFHRAAESGSVNVMKFLIEKKLVDIEEKNNDEWGTRPLHLAATNGHEDAIVLLINNGADINATNNKNGNTPLHFAAINGHLGSIRILLEHGAVNEKDKNGNTVIDRAIKKLDLSSGVNQLKNPVKLLLTTGIALPQAEYIKKIDLKPEQFNEELKLKISDPDLNAEKVNNNKDMQEQLAIVKEGLPLLPNNSMIGVVYQAYTEQFKKTAEEQIGITPAITPAQRDAFEKTAIDYVTIREVTFKEVTEYIKKKKLEEAKLEEANPENLVSIEEKTIIEPESEKKFVSMFFPNGKSTGSVPSLKELASRKVMQNAAEGIYTKMVEESKEQVRGGS